MTSDPAESDAYAAALPVIEGAIDFVGRRQRLTADAVDELRGEVHLRLLTHDGLARFEHRSSLRTFLVTVVHHVLLDIRNRDWQQRFRPSSEATRLGATAVQLEQLIVRDGHPPGEAVELLLGRTEDKETRAQLSEMADRLPRRVRRRFVGPEGLDRIPAGLTPEDALLGEERQTVAAGAARAAGAALAALPPDDRLVLRMRFHDGATVATIARVLRLDQKALYRRIDRLLERMRTVLQDAGFSSDEVLDALGGSAKETRVGGRPQSPPLEEAG